MPKAIDVRQELAALRVLEGRSAETSEEEAEAAFATLADYRDGAVYAGSFAGESPWERHPKGDEFVQIVKGRTRLTIMTAEGPEDFELAAGMIIVVPQGCWHRFRAPEGVSVLTITPQPTEHSQAEDPRGFD